MTLERLPKDHFIELADVLTGGRKLAIVDATGVGYFDVLGDDSLPLPLHSELNPIDLGTINQWHEDLPGQKADPFLDAWEYLTNQQLDVLTIARALRWGVQNNSFDGAILLSFGKAETERVRNAKDIAARRLAAS